MTPEAFRAWRKSRMWAALTYQANVDIHQVRAAGDMLRCAERAVPCMTGVAWMGCAARRML